MHNLPNTYSTDNEALMALSFSMIFLDDILLVGDSCEQDIPSLSTETRQSIFFSYEE
jgi:hypothetical protein